MKRWRLVIDLVVFAGAAVGLVLYGIVDLLGDPLSSSTQIAAVFPDASGISHGFTVWLNGVDVGSVAGVRLVDHGARVDMRINPGISVPGDVVASVDIANDLGEQVVELTPAHGGTAPALRSGAVVPVVKGGIPVEVSAVVASASKLLRAIPAGRLNQLLRELATGLRGRSADLRTIVADSTTFSAQILRYQDQLDALFANAPPVLDSVSSVGPQLQAALANSQAIVAVLAKDSASVRGALTNGSVATGALQQLLTSQAPDLACVVHDLSDVAANLDQPSNLSNLSSSLALNQFFFTALTRSAEPGRAEGLVSGTAGTADQTFLRTRILLPPASPPGDAYSQQQGLPDILPAAGCTTELGKGVDAASQPGFRAAAGGTVVPPTAADAVVRGKGDGQSPTTPAARATATRPAPAASPSLALLVTGVVVVPALALAWGARPARRRARRRA